MGYMAQLRQNYMKCNYKYYLSLLCDRCKTINALQTPLVRRLYKIHDSRGKYSGPAPQRTPI